jgi:ribose transport system permease protein
MPRSFGFERLSGLYLLALFIVVFGLWEPSLFLTMDTVHIVASSQAVVAMMAMGLLVPLITGAYDLSIGATANLTALLVTVLQTGHGMNMWVAIVISLCAACAIGLLNGFIVVKLRVNSFIATLGMATIIGAVETIVTGGSQPTPPTSTLWSNLTQWQVGGFQVILAYVVILGLLLWWLLEHTPAGRYFYAVGSNADAARLSGVRVDRWTRLSLLISSAVCGVAGILYASSSGPSLTFGPALLLPAFAAVFLGSTQLKPGRFNVWGTLLAVYVLATGVQGLEYVTGVQWLSDMFNGVALIAAVSMAMWRQHRTRAVPVAEDSASVGTEPAGPGDPNGLADPATRQRPPEPTGLVPTSTVSTSERNHGILD